MQNPAEDPELAALRAPKCPHALDYIALGAGLLPFMISFRSSHTESFTVTGNADPSKNISSSHTEFKDPVAIAGGGLALVLALATISFWRGTLPQKKALRIGLTLGALVLGIVQLVLRGGLLT